MKNIIKIIGFLSKFIDVLYNIIISVLNTIGKAIVFLIAFAKTNSFSKSKSAVKFIFSGVDHPVEVIDQSKNENNLFTEYEVVEEKSKKEELQESLRFLKSKPNKSVKDKNNIGIIEAVLKNM